MRIRDMVQSDYEHMQPIYQAGIDSLLATFETTVPSWSEWDEKHHNHSRCVAVTDERVVGFAALAPVSKRHAYRGVAEVSVYVDESQHGKGIGKTLINELIERSEEHGIWTLQSVILSENKASIHIHEQCGFRHIGVRENIAKLNGEWRSTVMMERRSSVIA
ncbi:GNAT family N-acetyltransferase [Geomicrobium sp. JCM 19038]|uniref:GNAT family N-acetyltransferase n=1 Tax=Geomicrobium sp. JCM 19038 TaxID=1460635 RepID=UPI00045F13B8|nr:GNAT family N-acetyltransferase [Geomicrobium sp. JCM 19038]GAK07454.1 phosphinothricin N-acetyltransferase [Geomicrobium sp. JCM 19038]